MKQITFLMLLFVNLTISGQTNYLRPKSDPSLRIESVVMPKGLLVSPTVTFEIKAIGETPLAVEQSQFSIVISQPGVGWFNFDELLFLSSTNIIMVKPGNPQTLSINLRTNDVVQLRNKFEPGKCIIMLHLNSDKVRHFDYQWLGQQSARFEAMVE
jgi:hypothetical protein